MSLRHALLGFLTTEPASGYRLAQEFGDSMGWFWFASHSQIHPELQRMEREKLIRSERADEGGRGKRIYSITPAGRAEFDRWLCEDTVYPPVRDPERIRLIFLDQQPPEVIRKHLEAHRAHHENLCAAYSDQLRQIREETFPRLRKRLASQPPHTHQLVKGLKELALEGNVMRARGEVEWAQRALRWLDGLENGEGRRAVPGGH